MLVSSFVRPLVLALSCAMVFTQAVPARAQVLSNTDQGCVNGLNKAGQKVGATQGKDNTACIKDDGNGKLTPPDADACLLADRKGKVGAAESKTSETQTSKCASLPPYGATSATTVNTAAKGEELSLVTDIFGPTLDAVILTDSAGKGCQATVSKTYEKFSATYIKEYNGCKKTNMKAGTIANEAGLEACLGQDPKGKIGKAATKILDGLTKKCVGVTLATAFPGECIPAAGANPTFADCVEAAAICHACLAVNEMDGIERGCDSLDDGLLNATCRECGNGTTEVPETCDDGGETATCDSDCTAVSCGDGLTNVTAGEQCDDANVNNNDACLNSCDDATCGDGVICNAGGCTSGPGGGLEQCDNAGANSNVTPDACRTNCANASCGDGVIDTGETCDDGNVISGDGCSATCQSGPGSGENDPLCPALGQLVLYAGTTTIPCATNGDCIVGQCNPGLGVCITDTALDTGWTGLAHDADTNDQVLTMGNLLCEGPFVAGPEPCGVCDVVGINPDTGDCRCANDNRVKCDTPFAADANDCGGQICNCYFGAPLPLSSSNTPACVVNRFANDISGTANVDLGAGKINANLASLVYLGEDVLTPCPSCGGTCTTPPANLGDPCAHNYQCDTTAGSADGTCANYDPVPGDGIRGGTCYAGKDPGKSCDGGATNASFPNPGGGYQSLDCFPSTGLNVSGGGLKIELEQTTGSVSLPAGVVCGFNVAPELCPCGVCTLDTATTCTSNADCTGFGNCAKAGDGKPRQNQCANGICSDVGGGEGNCLADPGLKYCDGVARADGQGFVTCLSNADCAALGTIMGDCTLTGTKECFLDPISATGVQDPNFPVGVAAFCIAATSNAGINSVAGLPGPGRVKNVASAETFCASNLAVNYTPGVGGCPP